MDQFLEKLFESVPKARILRLFLQNPYDFFSLEEVNKRTQIKKAACKKEIDKLLKLAIVRQKNFSIRRKNGRKARIKKFLVFGASPNFGLFKELRDLVSRSSVASRAKLVRQIRGLGRVKLAVVSGVFINQENSRTDLLLVGESIFKRKLGRFLVQLESELGRSIQYTVMDTEEFKYRLGMYDRFLRDILEYPHQKLINKLET